MDRVRQMFHAHPAPASEAGDVAFALVKSAAECALVCTTCADACLSEDGAMEACIRRCIDCAELCTMTARLIARPGPQDRASLAAALDACRAACKACAEECSSHADDMDHCRICAEVCRECEAACAAMKEALVAA